MTFPHEVRSILEWILINPDDFNLRDSYFDHHSDLHGISHSYRVMVNTLLIGNLLNDKRAGLLAFCGAYIHDMARKHDGGCLRHGADSTKYKLPLFMDLFAGYGITSMEIKQIGEAVSQHSTSESLTPSDDGYHVMAILKDADALDRCRLYDLKPEFLRYTESHQLIDRARVNYEKTRNNYSCTDFISFIDCLA